jgi:hypothetical protein
MGKADHSPPSSAEVKNAWSYTSTPPIRFRGVVFGLKKHRDNFTFTFHTAYVVQQMWMIMGDVVAAYFKILSLHLLRRLSWSPGADTNPGPKDYEAGMPTIRLRCGFSSTTFREPWYISYRFPGSAYFPGSFSMRNCFPCCCLPMLLSCCAWTFNDKVHLTFREFEM